jgi:hypothetical protein
MNPTVAPILSPAFARARKLSRIMALIFTIGFWTMLVAFIVLPLWGFARHLAPGFILHAALRQLPILIITYHAGKVFACFAQDKVFAPEPLNHIRAIGIWLIVLAPLRLALGLAYVLFLGLTASFAHLFLLWVAALQTNIGTAVMGLSITIAAYVMAEANRIAADHAEIV